MKESQQCSFTIVPQRLRKLLDEKKSLQHKTSNMSYFGIALSVILLLRVLSMTSAFPSPNYRRCGMHGAQPMGSLYEAREQQRVYAARPNWRGDAARRNWRDDVHIEGELSKVHFQDEREETDKETSDRREEATSDPEEAGEETHNQREETADEREETGEETSDRREEAGEETSNQREETADEREETGEETSDRREEAGEETSNQREETADERGETRESNGNGLGRQRALPTQTVLTTRRDDDRMEQDCESDYAKCDAAGLVPIRQCIQTYYLCIGIEFQYRKGWWRPSG